MDDNLKNLFMKELKHGEVKQMFTLVQNLQKSLQEVSILK
jgi:hypothetical protein